MTLYRTPPRLLAKRPGATGTIAGEGAQIPVVYGIDRRQALVSSVTDGGDRIILVCIWSVGEIDAITGLTLNDRPFPAETGYAVRHYLGTPDQGADPGLKAIRPDYDDTLTMQMAGETVAVAYSVVEIPTTIDFPVIAATIRGRKVHDPRSGQTAWSDNPALCLADYIQSATYGQGRPVTGVEAAANACDELVGGQHRRTVGLSVNDGEETNRERWAETLRQYAGCFIVPEGAARKLVPDRPAAVARQITPADVRPGSVTLKFDHAQAATVYTVSYTDTDGVPWRDARAVAYAAGVQAGAVPWIEEAVTLPGIHNSAQAAREAAERLASAQKINLEVNFDAYDFALALQTGDVVELALPEVSGQFRIMAVDATEPGRYRVTAALYDPSIYSDSTAGVEIIPPPIAPRFDSIDEPNVGGVTSGGGTYVEGGDGTIHNRIRIDLAPPSSPDFSHFEIRFRRRGTADPWQTGEVVGTTAFLYPVQDGIEYEYETRAVGRKGEVSAWTTGTHTVEKKNTPPPKPTNLDVDVSPSGTRTITFDYPNPPADLAGFRIQYDAGDGYVDLLDGLTMRRSIETEKMPGGSVTIRVHAQDTSQNTSAWAYKTSNIEQGPDGKWYDVDQRIAAEQARNDNQDGVTIPAAQQQADNAWGKGVYLQNDVIPPIDATATTGRDTSFWLRDSKIPPIESTADNAWGKGLYLENDVIPPIDATAGDAYNTGVWLRDSKIPPVEATANDGKNTSYWLRDSKIPPIEGAANDARNTSLNLQNNVIPPIDAKAGDAQSTSYYLRDSKIPPIETTANDAKASADWSRFTKIPEVENNLSTTDGKATDALNKANQLDNDVNGAGGLRFVSGDASAKADQALSRADQAYAEAVAGGVDGSRLIPNTITYDKLNILNLGSISANIGTVTAGLIQSSTGASSMNLDGGNFLSAGSGKFIVGHQGTVYAQDIYIYGTWPKSCGKACRTTFTGYVKIDEVLGEL